MKQTKSTAKFTFILIAILVIVFTGVFSVALFGNSINVDTDLSVADAANYSSNATSDTITLGRESLSGTAFSLTELWNPADTASSYWTQVVGGSKNGTWSNESDGTDNGFGLHFTTSDNDTGFSYTDSYALEKFTINVPVYMTVTNIALTARLYAYANGNNGLVSKYEYTKTELQIVDSTESSVLGTDSLQQKTKGKQNSSSNAESSKNISISTGTVSYSNTSIKVRLVSWCKRDSTGSDHSTNHYSQVKNISITVTGTLNSYDISYDLDGGSLASGVTNPAKYTYDDSFTLNNPTKTGYTFVGWSGTGIDGTSMSVTVPAGSYENRSYTANWKPTYHITYNLNGGTNNSANPTSYTVLDSFTLQAPTRTGYTFAGWSGYGIGNGTTDVSIDVTVPKGSEGNKSYTANWSIITYTISYDLKNGSVSTANPTTYNVETATFTLNNPTKTGYTFTGWTGSNGTTAQTSVSIAKGSTGNKSYTANWSIITYTITYDLKNGSVSTANPTTYNVETATFTLNNPTKTGYTFTGWTKDGSAITRILKGSYGDITIVANWTAITYTISYDSNKPSTASATIGGSTASSTHTYDTAKNLTSNGYTLTGWTFDGWATSASGARSYDDGASVTNLASTQGATVTLYAHWTAITYNISYDIHSNASYGTNHPVSATYDVAFTVSAPSRPGYYFTGWTATSGLNTSTAKWGKSSADTALTSTSTKCINGASDVYFVNLSSTVSSTVTLTANFARLKYIITFNAGTGGSGTMDNQTGTYASANVTINTNAFTRDDAFFTGWKDTKDNKYSNGGSITKKILQSYQTDTTTSEVTIPLTAQWWSEDLEFGVDGSGTGNWGSSTNPYIIRSTDHLTNLRNIVNGGTTSSSSDGHGSIIGSQYSSYTNPQAEKGEGYSGCYFKLAADISSITNASPIGNTTYPFKGTFDGNSLTISGVSITTTSPGDILGLFGYIKNATIKNLKVSASINAYGQSYVGAIVGYAKSSTITGCTSSGSVLGSSSINTSPAGYSSKASDLPMTLIQWDYKHNNVAEGILEIFDNDVTSKLCNGKSTMSFIVDLGATYYLTGFSFSCANDTSEYTKRNIKNVYIWGFTSNPNYTSCWTDGSGGKPTDADPVNKGVTGGVQLYGGSVSMTTTQYLRQDFNLSSTGNYRYVWVWVEGSDGLQFSEFDVIGDKSNYVGGTIGYAESGCTISDCTNKANVYGFGCVGGIVGGTNFANSGTQCTLSGTLKNNVGLVKGNASFVGGIIGMCFSTTASNVTCENYMGGVYSSADSVGGIFGFANDSVGSNGTFINNAPVTGGTAVGGIVGRSQTHLKNCTNKGMITGTLGYANGECDSNVGSFVGGITGYTTSNVTISNSYNKATITSTHASGNFIGGIVGYAQGDVTYCYNSGSISGAEYLGGICGHSKSAIDYCYDYNDSSASTITASASNPHIGGISGGAVSTGTSWIIGPYNYTSSNLSAFGKRIYGYSSFSNIVPLAGTTETTWENIINSNIDGVKITETASSGEYIKLTSDSLDGNTYFAPSVISSSSSNGAYEVVAQYYFTDDTKKNNIYIKRATITIANNVKQYDTTPLAITNSTQIDGYSNELTYANNKTSIVNFEDSTTVTLKVYVTYNSNKVYVGELSAAATITKVNIDVKYESKTFTYDGNSHTIALTDVFKYTDSPTIEFNSDEKIITLNYGSTTEKIIATLTTKTDVGVYENCIATYDMVSGYGTLITNYNIGLSNTSTSTLTITQREIVVSSPIWTDGKNAGVQDRTTDALAFTYNGSAQGLNTFTITNTLAESNVNYDGYLTRTDSNVKAGSDSYTYKIYLADTKNFTLSYYLGETKTTGKTEVTYTYKILQRSIQDATVVLSTATKTFNCEEITISGNKYYVLNTSYSSYLEKPAIIYATANDTSYKANIKLFYNNVDELVSGTDFVALTESTVLKLTDIYSIARGTESSPSVTITSIAKGNYNGTCNIWFTLMGSDYGKLSTGTGTWGSSTNPYIISSTEHMLRLAYIVNSNKNNAWNSINGVNSATAQATDNTYANSYFEVIANVSISKDGGFKPIGSGHWDSTEKAFVIDSTFAAKQFNGDNHTITINYVNTGTNYAGIFGYADGTLFRDVKVAGTVSGYSYVGGLCGYLNGGSLQGTFDNSASITGLGDYIAGLVGYFAADLQTTYSLIKGTNTGTIKGVNDVGGAIGYIKAPLTSGKEVVFDSYINKGTITSTGNQVGGILGYHYNSTAGGLVYFMGCQNNASVSGAGYVGGILGRGRDVKLNGCTNGEASTSATITGTGNNIGGIIGYADAYSQTATISKSGQTCTKSSNSKNYMSISGATNVGGIIGGLAWGSTIQNVENYGTITGSGNNVGGICGNLSITCSLYQISSVKNTASVSGSSNVGGILGLSSIYNGNSTYVISFKDATNSGTVLGTSNVGGIVGITKTATKFEGTNTNSAQISGTDNCIGGIAGNANDVSMATPTIRNTAIIKGSATSNYIGGLFGYITIGDTISSATLESYGTYAGKDYVGGIAGYLNTNAKTITAKFISDTTYNGVDYSSAGETVALVGKFGGNFFGYTEGNGTIIFSLGTSSTHQIDAAESNILSQATGVCVGGVCGANINVVLDFRNVTTNFLSGFSIIVRSKQDVEINDDLTLKDATLCGGICGYNSGTIYLNSAKTLEISSMGSTNQGNYVGGLVGYNTGNVENINININAGMIDSSKYPSSYVGGICGYNSGTITNIVSVAGTVAGINYVGGLIGYNASAFTCTTTISHSNAVSGSGTIGFVGGAIGYSSATTEIKNFTQSGAVTSSGSYVGGIIGYADDAKINNSKYSVTEITGVSYVGGIAGYWGIQSSGAIDNNVTTSASVMATGSFVGGIAGFVTVSKENLFTSYTPTLKNSANNLTVQGKSYLGGLFGYFEGGEYKKSTQASKDSDTVIHIDNTKISVKVTSTGTTASSKGDAIGGLFGYVASCGVVFDTNWSTSYSFTASGTGATFTTNANYVGGIAGIIGSNATIEYNASSSTGANTVITNNMGFSITGDYVGGIAGYVSPFAGAYNQSLVFKFGDLINVQNTTYAISGTNYVGGLYGYIGDSKEEITYTITQKEITNTVVLIHSINDLVDKQKADSAPSGYDANNYCYTYSEVTSGEGETATVDVVYTKYYYKSINSLTASDISSYTVPATTEIIFNLVGERYIPISYSLEVPTGSKETIIDEYHTGKTEFSALASYQNITSITNTTYYTQITTNENNGIRLSSDTNYLVFDPKLAINEKAISATESYAGGLIGYVGTHARLNLVNSQIKDNKNDTDIVSALTIRNGNAGTDANITAATYAGGIVGYLSNEAHYFENIVNIGAIGSGTSKYVGGLVGRADGGSYVDCISTTKSHISNPITSAANNYLGTEYVGGLIGYLGAGSLTNSYSMGFMFGEASGSDLTHNTSSLKGGVVGYAGSSAVITNSWTYYLAQNVSYSTNSKNTYGKYILIEANSSVALAPRFGELAYMAGIYTGVPQTLNATINGVTSVAIAKGSIYIALNLYDTLPLGSQLAFYDANGSDKIYSEIDSTSANSTGNIGSRTGNTVNDFSKNQKLYLKLASSCASLIIDIVPITLSNIPVYTSNITADTTINDETNDENEENIRASYVRPSNYSGYDLNIFTATYGSNKYVKNVTGTVAITIGANRYEIGAIKKDITTGDEASPWLISNVTEWNEFATKVKDGTSFSGQTVRLVNDITLTSTISNLAGSSDKSFSGTFDGDGYTINIGSITATANGTSLFMNANGATFKNLTLAGSIAGAGYSNIGAYVGSPAGNLTFENCTSKVEITNVNENAGGFVGYSNNVSKITFLTCVNDAYVESKAYKQPSEGTWYWTDTYAQVTFGTGGIIGQVASSTTLSIDSCRNTANGTIVGGHNVGGIIGVAHSSTNIYNCANSGNIWAVTALSLTSDRTGISGDHTQDAENENSYRVCSNAGGIIGKLSGSGILKLYSSYNDGQITGISNMVGGLVGCISDFTCGKTGSADESSSAGQSYVCYCYNTGLVQAGGTQAKYTPPWYTGETLMNGTIVGGLIGFCGPAIVRYSYNTGRVISWSGASYGGWEYQARMGGIIGQSAPTNSTTLATKVTDCYNVGTVELRVAGSYSVAGYSTNQVNFYYGGGIIGYLDAPFNSGNAKDYTSYENIYSIHYCCYRPSVARKSGSEQWLDAGEAPSSYSWVDSTGNRVSGVSVLLEDLTATYTEEGSSSEYSDVVCAVSAFSKKDAIESKKSGSAISMIDDQFNDIDYTTDSDFLTGNYYGWVFAYGCLPQLAMFSLDTKEGLAMTSTSFGQDEYGNWQSDRAGSEQSPYIIKDGIDLLLLSALNAAQYHNYFYTFEGKYIEFANGTNNISNTASKTITLANDNSTRTNNYKASDGTSSITGKSYHLYLKGAVCNDVPTVTSGTAYTNWKNKNRYYNGSAWASGCEIATINFYPIGMKGPFSYFAGNISGEQGTGGNTVIENVKVDITKNDSAYAGLFGYTQGANISYITVNGTIKGRTLSTQAYSANAGGEVMVGAIAGYAGADTTIEHCFAGNGNGKCTITGVSASENPNTYVGGIVGKASTITFDNVIEEHAGTITNDGYNYSNRNSILAGSYVNIVACESYANVTTPKNNAGGIIGYATAYGYNSTTTDKIITGSATKVKIQDCNVKYGTITAEARTTTTMTYGTDIGGIIGASDDYIEMTVSGGSVGNSSFSSITGTYSVNIIGENKVGGIIGSASTNDIIGVTGENAINIYGDTKVTRGNSWGEVNNNYFNGTDYGVSIGGLVGFTVPNTSATTVVFAGNIISNAHVYIDKESATGSEFKAIGGAVGYMGSGALFREGCSITIDGTIEIAESIATDQFGIGGVAGIANNVAFNGTFIMQASIVASKATKVGGFIGLSLGQTEILAGSSAGQVGSQIVIVANILAVSEVGGFVGEIDASGSLNIGSDAYKGSTYSGTLSIEIQDGTYIKASGNSSDEANVGGIVGFNDGTISIVKGTLINKGDVVGGAEDELPEGYQGLEYVQTTGTQYIDTGVTVTDTIGIQIKLSSQDVTTDLVYIGQRVQDQKRTWIGAKDSKIYYGWNELHNYSDSLTQRKMSINSQYTLSMNFLNSRECEFQGDVLSSNLGTYAGSDKSIYIGTGNDKGSPYSKNGKYSSIKIYSVKISDGANIIHNYIPCKTSSGAIGLYDVIGQAFYASKTSTTLVAGPTYDYTAKDNVGGIVGLNEGTISFEEPTVTNEGNVYGRNNVGGTVGFLSKGSIAGTFTNKGNVTGKQYVGGSFGNTTSETLFTIPSTQDKDGNIEYLGASLFANEGNVTGEEYVGGSIGLVLGEIEGSSSYLVKFTNKGTVTTGTYADAQYIGGSVGALAGTVTYTSFVNQGTVSTKGYRAIGGSIGIVGVPSALAKYNIIHKDTVFDNVHFEFNSETGLSVGPDTYDSETGATTAGGVGGIIGVIYNAKEFTVDNSFYVLSSVSAPNLTNVGGSIGLIQGGTSITVDGLLAYNTTVTGYQNVGGIVGAVKNGGANVTISNSFNVSISDESDVKATIDKGKKYGGIVGYVEDTAKTDASTSYWVKGFPNAELASLNIDNVKNVGHSTVSTISETFSDAYSLASTVYSTFEEDISYYSRTGSGTTSSPYEYTKVENVTAETYLNLYVNQYKYSIGFCNAHPITAFLELTGQEDLKSSIYSWDSYIANKFNAEVNNKTVYQDGNGNFVRMVPDGEAYITGEAYSGYYFLFAKDTGTITVQHSSSTETTLTDLSFWKRIAWAYTADEIAAGTSSIELHSDIAPQFQNDTVTGTSVTSVTKGGTVKQRTVYARALSEYQTGYFLYVKSSNSTSTAGLQTYHEKSTQYVKADTVYSAYFSTVTYYTKNSDGTYTVATGVTDANFADYYVIPNYFYVMADLNQNPYNVVVYYRSVGMGSALTYNGNTRFAPLTLKSSEVSYLSAVPTGQNTGRVNSYSYLVSAEGGTGRDVGSYKTDVTLYYYDATGYPYEVGFISQGEWRIVARQLQASVAPTGKRVYDGTNTEGYVDIEISNFEMNDASNATVKITFSPASGNHSDETGTYTYIYTMGSTSAPVGESGASSKYITPYGNVELKEANAVSGDESFNTVENPVIKTYTATIRFKITSALSYSVLVDTFTGKTAEITNDYTMNSETGTITVQAKELTITFKDNGSHQYDGSEFSNEIEISGWATSDSSASARQDWFASFYPYYKDNTGAVTYYKDYEDAKNNTDPTVALVTTSGGVSTVSVKGTNKGTYYFGFNTSKSTSTTSIGTATSEIYSDDGNYKIKLTPNNPKAVLSIAENSLTLVFTPVNKTYDTKTTTIVATFTAKYALADTNKWAAVLDDYMYSIVSKTDATKNVPTTPGYTLVYTSKSVATVTFTTHTNADTYVAQILGPKVTNENCPVDLTTSPTTGSQVSGRDCWKGEVKISKKALTVNATYSAQPSGGYVYNTSYQGLESITLTGFVGSESINNTGAYGTGNGTTIHLSPSTLLTATSATNGYSITGTGDAGSYSVYISISAANSNYSLAKDEKTWTIAQKVISLGSGSTTSSYYTGMNQEIAAVWGTDASLSGSGDTRTYYKDTLTITFTYKASSTTDGKNYACNVGKYDISVASANSVKATRGSLDKSANYYLDESSTSYKATHEILAVEIVVGFDGNVTFVYTGNQQGPKISTASAGGTSLARVSTSFTEAKFTGLYAQETITINLTGSGNSSASTTAYTASTGTFTVEGNNEAGATSSSNYTLKAASQSYNINKSKIKVEMSASSLTKVYDGTTTAKIGLSAITLSSTNNGAVLPSSAIQDNNTTVTEKESGMLYGSYDNKNVGTGKTVTFSISNTSTTNFVLVDNSGNETNEISSLQINTGVITQRPVTITLNLSRNKATKTYDGDNSYATYNNKSATNGKTTKYKSGQGFIVANAVSGDDFIVTATFKESDTTRSYFDSFINNITREGTDPNYTYKTTTGTFKKLVFEVSSSTGTDYLNYMVEIVGFTNAVAMSDATGANVLTVYDSSDTDSSRKNAVTTSTISISITAKTITATYNNTTQSYANDDNSFNLNWKAVTGTPTAALSSDNVSFAMVNGWMYKTGIDPNANSTGVDIQDTSLAETYKKYTTIRGVAGSNKLSAKLVSSNGRHLNYILRQQPTLTIGYFVNQDGYEINSYAGLMMATYYYSTNFMQTTYDDESVATATLVTTWNTNFVISGATYTCSYSDYENNNLPDAIKEMDSTTKGKKITTWDEFFEVFRAYYNEGKDEKFQIAAGDDGIRYEGEGETGAYGYWVNVAEPRTTYLSFRQTKNIDARLTANDIAIIEGQFGTTWGYGTKYLSNFIKCSANEICVAINAIFPIIQVTGGATYGFVGTYNGNGYTIENMTIVANYVDGFSYGTDSIYAQLDHGTYNNASAGGVGMFALVNSATLPSFTNNTTVQNGGVYGVNIRNATISVNDSIATTNASTLAVGGIIAVSQMTTTMTSCSFHGSIVVNTNGTRNHIGGIVGLYVQPSADIVTMIEGAIVAGTIIEHQAIGSNDSKATQLGCGDVGGIVGRAVGIESSKTLVIKDVVSIAQILAVISHTNDGANNVGGLVGTAWNTAATFITGTAAYITDSALRVLDATTTIMNNAIGYTNNGTSSNLSVSYDTLRSESNTAYASTIYSPKTLTQGTYDVISESTASDSNDTRISSRLVDIIDIYVLMYTRETAEVGDADAKVTIVKKLTTSKLVGTKTGTTTDRINIVNQQHVALIRELPFANFNLTGDVEMYKTHSAAEFEGFFYGTILNEGNYKIYLAENTSNNMFKWNLTGHTVPTSTGLKASASK